MADGDTLESPEKKAHEIPEEIDEDILDEETPKFKRKNLADTRSIKSFEANDEKQFQNTLERLTSEALPDKTIGKSTTQDVSSVSIASQGPSANGKGDKAENKQGQDNSFAEQGQGDFADKEGSPSTQATFESQESEAPPPPPRHSATGLPQMDQIHDIYQMIHKKLYYGGFVYKKNELGANGRPLRATDNVGHQGQIDTGGEWSKWWMELWGPVLQLWRCPDELAGFPYCAGLDMEHFISNEFDPPLAFVNAIKSFHQAPIYINIADVVSQTFDADFRPKQDCPPPPIPYTSFFGISTAGSNLYLFATWSSIQTNNWMTAIRLLTFEMSKLNQAFTWRLLRQPQASSSWLSLGVPPMQTLSFRGELKYEGPLQVRTAYSTQWKEFYVVVTSEYLSDVPDANSNFIGKKLFGKKESKDPSKRGLMYFYQSKSHVKRKPPVFTMEQVDRAACMWPEKPELLQMNMVSLARIHGQLGLVGYTPESEGVVDTSDRTLAEYKSGFPIISSQLSLLDIIEGRDKRPPPDSIMILANSTHDLAKWMVAILGAFSVDSDPEPEEREIGELVYPTEQPWPSILYFSVNEISGISMNTSAHETFVYLRHYLSQKVSFSKQSKLRMWCEATAKGEWERKLLDRKEVESKLKILFDWVKKTKHMLQKKGIELSNYSIAEVITKIVALFPDFETALYSLVPDLVKKSPTVASLSEKAPSEASAKPVSEKMTTSDEEGSQSMSDDTSEGSQSDEESPSLVSKKTTSSASVYWFDLGILYLWFSSGI